VAWLLRDDEVLASLEVADTHRARARGLLGRDGVDGLDGLEGALLLPHTRSVHSLGMRFPIDVAYCDGDLTVIRTFRLAPHRLARPSAGVRQVIEAEAGAFARWNLVVGDRLDVRP